MSGLPINPKHELHFQIFFQRKCTCVCVSTHYCCANIWSCFIKLSRDGGHMSIWYWKRPQGRGEVVFSLHFPSNGIYVCILYQFCEHRCLHKTLLLFLSAISLCCMVPSGMEGGSCSCIQEVVTFKWQGSKHHDAYASPVSAALYLHFISTISVLLSF